MKILFLFICSGYLAFSCTGCKSRSRQNDLPNGFKWTLEDLTPKTQRLTVTLHRAEDFRVVTDALIEDGMILTLSPTPESWIIPEQWNIVTESDWMWHYFQLHADGTITILGNELPINLADVEKRWRSFVTNEIFDLGPLVLEVETPFPATNFVDIISALTPMFGSMEIQRYTKEDKSNKSIQATPEGAPD